MSHTIAPETVPEGFVAGTIGPYSTLIGPLMYKRYVDEQGRKHAVK
ncbi:MAG: hypothetical protein R3F38_17355 [Gammaproteobacteria bacterium]